MRHNSDKNSAPLLEVEPAPELRRLSPSVRSLRSVLFGLALSVVAYYALFRLPFWFPPRQRLVSASYAFGFNNSVAILALAALLGAVSLLYFLRRGKAIELPIAFPWGRTVEVTRSTHIVFATLALCYAALTFGMYVYNARSAPPLMWETVHLVHRSMVMQIYGLHPYTEIAAEYGPILTYAPIYIYWLLKPLGASHELAYFVCHLLLNLAGLWCAYYVLSRAVIPHHERLVAFVVLAIAGFAPYMGINGVLTRYLFPFASLLLGQRSLVFALSRRNYAESCAIAAVSILLLLIANVLLSPEIGIAFAVAWLVYAVLTARSELRVLASTLIAFAATALFCWLLLPPAYYGTLLRFSEGANNLPLLPAAHLLLYILTLFLVVPPLLAVCLRHWRNADSQEAAICGALGSLCVIMAPGALGRCDPPHVLLFGMGASMLLMIRLANVSRAAFATYVVAYASVFIVLIEMINLRVFYGLPPQALLSRPVAQMIKAVRSSVGTEHLSAATLSALDRYPRLGLPFASFGDPAVERYVVSRGQLQPEYYVAIVGVYNAKALDRKLSDVGKAEYLLVPTRFIPSSPPDDARHTTSDACKSDLLSLRQWFFYPAKLSCRAKALDPFATVQKFIADHYLAVEQVGSWSVLHKVTERSSKPLQ